jgi:hypothetical protein
LGVSLEALGGRSWIDTDESSKHCGRVVIYSINAPANCCNIQPMQRTNKQILEEEEIELNDFLDSQRRLLLRYRVSRWMLLWLGITFVAGALVWMAYKHADLSGLDKFVPAFTLLGGGLIATSATTYPISEILKRKERIMYCKKLKDNINKVRVEEQNRKINVDRIRKKCQEAIDMLKEC